MGTARHHYKPRTHAIGQQLLALRNRTGLTQTELGQLIGVSRRSILKWEGGEGVPNGTHLHHLLEIFANRNAFTAGQELAEAETLWDAVSQAASKRLGQFNAPWFTQLLAQPGIAALSQSPTPDPRTPIIDWGEAIAVPSLQGRAAELVQIRQWVLADRCRVVALLGLGGIGKTSLALTFAHAVRPHFAFVLFRSLQNGPALAEVLDQAIHAVSGQQATSPEKLADKIALLIQLFRERRCLLILDNFETIMQPGTITGTYRSGYAEYGPLLRALSERMHESCVILTSREKPAELGSLQGRAGPVRTLALAGLGDEACQSILEAQAIVGTPHDLHALARLYSGNPLALALVAEPIRELFGGDLGAFLAAGNAFFNGVGALLYAQLARSTPLEQAILYWLAIEREHVPLSALLRDLGEDVPQREVLAALESLRHRMLIERGPGNATFTLQPVILEYVTDSLIELVAREVADGRPRLLSSHAIVLATAKEYVRRSQEQLIAVPLLDRLGKRDAVERQLLNLLAFWRNQPHATQGYGPGNVVNLLRLLRGHLRNLDLAHLRIQQAVLHGADVQDTSLAGAVLRDTLFTETFDAITAVAISSSGEYWAAASTRGEVLVWAAAGPILHRSWRAHTDMVWTLAFSPDGRALASGSWDGAVKLWNVASGALLWVSQHTGHVNRVAFSPDGSVLASSLNDATVRLCDSRTGRQLETLGHPGPVPAIAWSADGRMLASGDVQGDIRLWNVWKHRPATCEQVLTGHSSWIDALAFAPDSGTLASASWDGTIKLWNTSAALGADATGAYLLQTLAGHSDQVSRVVWSPDGRTLASSSRDQTIRLWDAVSASVRAVLQGHTAGAKGLAFTPDSRSLLSGGGDGVLRMWDSVSGECTRVMQGYAASLDDVDWSPDGAQLVSGGTDTVVTVYSIDGATAPRTMIGHGGLVIGVGWSAGGQWLASSEWDNAIRLWSPASGASIEVVQHPSDPENCFYGLAWSPDGQRLAAGTNRHGVFVWDVRAHAQPWAMLEFPTWIRHVAWSPDGTQVAGGGDDGTVYLWDAINGTSLYQLPGHHSMVMRLAWSPDGAQLVSAGGTSAGGELLVWDAQRGECVHAITDHPGIVYAVAWGASAEVLISGGADGTLRWWDAGTGVCIRVHEAHQGRVQSLRRSPDGRTLASCGDGGAIRIWDLHSGALLQTIRRDRPYERLDITGTAGMSDAQRASLIALGAHEELDAQEIDAANSTPSRAIISYGVHKQQAGGDRNEVIGLPIQPTSFVGRNDELDAIERLLADRACRLVTLIGPGGIGKTRLALAAAARHSGTFADGVAFVPLASITTPGQIVFAIGDALALGFAGQADPTAHLLGHLRARHMLLVLDNFEHLLDGADLVADILAHAPQITLLITSRERLRLQAEWLVDLKGLAYPPDDPQPLAAQEIPTPPTDYSAVQLFVQRAAQSQPDLALSEAPLTTIVRICQQIAGMPLAIELAAASLRTLSLAEIEQQIRANLDVLATTLRDVPARHRSMRAVFDHSWHLLGESERALLSGLAVFRGGWAAEAAKQVVGASRGALTALIDKSLVYQATAPARNLAAATEPNLQGAPRYLMLEPIREYALERLAMRPDAETIRQRHALYFATLAEAAATEWNTPRIEAAIASLRREYDNMRAALQWASGTPSSELGLRLAQALWRFWRSRSHTSEGRVWLEQILALDEHPADPATIAARHRAIQAAAWLASDQHDFETATRLFEQSRVLRSALGESAGETELLINAARKARVAGHYQQATALLEDALARHRALASEPALGSAEPERSFDEFGLVLRELGLLLREQGEFSRASALFAEGLTLHRAIGDRAGEAFALLGLADVARDQGHTTEVHKYAEPSLAILRELGTEWAIGFALHTLALGTYYAGDVTRAFALIRESVALFRALKAEGSLAEVLLTLGKIALACKDQTAAYTALIEALQYAWAVGPRVMVAPALEGLASALVAQEQVELGTRLVAVAAALRAQMGTPVWPADATAVEQTLAAARATLSDTTFTQLWAEARSAPLEQILYRIPGAAAFAALDDSAESQELSSSR